MSLTCRSSKGLGAVIGLEVTDELDLNCYVEQTIDTSCWENAESLIEKYLSGFSHLIARLDLKCRKQKFLWS